METILCYQGVFTDNKIIRPYDDDVSCITYDSIRKEIEGHYGFFNLKYSEDLNEWVIFQYCLI